MSSSGVREENTSEKRVIKGLILNEEQFIQSLRVFANTSTLSGLGSTGGEVNNSPLEASGNYLTKSGDFMLGQFGNAFDGISATNIANDTLDVSKTSGVTFPVVILQGEGLMDDDLVTITEGEDVFPFQELWIRTRVNIITIKNSDNINTPDGADLVLPVGSLIKLVFDTFLGEWVIVAGNSLFGGVSGEFFGPWTADHSAGDKSLTNIQALVFNDSGGQINVDASLFNFVSTADIPFRFTPNSTDILDIDDTGLTMITGNIKLGNGNIQEVNQLAFNITGQTITDDVNGLRYSVPDTLDTHNFIIDSNTPVSIEKFFLNLSNTRIQMTQEIDPSSPLAGDIFVYSKLNGGFAKLFYKQSNGVVVGPLGNDKFLDGSFRIENTTVNSKRLKFDLVGATASTTITLKSQHTVDRTVTFPDAVTLLAGLSVPLQAWTGVNDFEGAVIVRDTFAIAKVSDITAKFLFDATNIPASTSRTFTVPNASGTIFITPAFEVLDMSGKDIVDVDDLTMSNALSVLNMSNGSITNVDDLTFLGISSDLDLNSGEILNVLTLTMFGNTAIINLSAGGNITAGGNGKGMTNIGKLDFIDNQATPAAALSIFSDGTDLFANTGAGTVNLSDIGPGSANTALSNLASVAINTALLPNADGVIDLGSATFSWDDVFAEKLRLETGGAITNTANMILADTLGMILNVPNNQQYTFRSNGDPILIIEEDEIRFGVSGSQHRINVNNAAIQIVAENPGDTVEFLNGTSAANPSFVVENFRSTWRTTTTDIQPYVFQLIQNNNTPANSRTIANIDGIAENSISVDTTYARISFSSQDITDGAEDGLLQLGIVSAGVLISGIDIEGGTFGANGALIGFFGETPVAQQSVASDTLANLYTALRNLGLIV